MTPKMLPLSDPANSHTRHPVEDIEPLPPDAMQIAREAVVLFVGQCMRMTMRDRDIVFRRALGQSWREIATVHCLGSEMAACIAMKRAAAKCPGVARFFDDLQPTKENPNG